MYSRFVGSSSSVMDSSTQRDEQEIAKVSEDANRAYDALLKEEEREHRLRFELETLLSMEANMLKQHDGITKETDVMDREIELLEHGNATREARTALASEKLSNTKRICEEKQFKVKEMKRKFEERQEKIRKHRQQMNEKSSQIKATAQQKLAEYRSMPLCNEFYELQNKLILLREKRDAIQKRYEEAEEKLVRIREGNKEQWQKFVSNCILAAKNYKKCKDEAIKKYQSTSRRAQDVLDRHYKKRDPGFAAPLVSKYMSVRTPFLSAWSRRQPAGVLYSAKDSTSYDQNSLRSSNYNSTPYSPYGKSRELMEKLKAIKTRPPPTSFFSSRKRTSGDAEDSPATKKPADANSVLKNFPFEIPTPRQDTQSSYVKKNDLLCIPNINDGLEQKARQAGSSTSISMEQPTYMNMMTSRISANESRSLNAEMKRSIISTGVHNPQQSQSNDGIAAPGTQMTASIPEQAEFLSQSGSKLVSLNNMNVSINVNVSQNNTVSTTQQLLGDGNGTGFFASPVFKASQPSTPAPSPPDFTAMVNHQLSSLVPGVSPIGSSPKNQYQQQGLTEATSTPNFLSLPIAKQTGTPTAPDFFMGLSGMDSTNDRSSPSGANVFSTDFFCMKPTPNSSANEAGSFRFDTNFGKDDGTMLDFPGFALHSDSVNNEGFNSNRPYF